MLNDQKVGINHMNVGIKIYVKVHILDIVETGFNLCILEKSKKQKVIVPANFSNIPVFETSE